MGPLLQERVRATAARHFDRMKTWVQGSHTAKAGEEALEIDKQERAKLQAMHAALLGHNASAGNASQALKQALGLVPGPNSVMAGSLRGGIAATGAAEGMDATGIKAGA